MRRLWYFLTRDRFSFLAVMFIGFFTAMLREFDFEFSGLWWILIGAVGFTFLFHMEKKETFVCQEEGCKFRVKANDRELLEKFRVDHQEQHFWRIHG